MITIRKHVFAFFVSVFFATLFSACGSQVEVSAVPTLTDAPQIIPTATEKPSSTPTITPTSTSPPTATPSPTSTSTPTPTATSTEAVLTLGEVVLVEEGGFSFQPVDDYLVDVHDSQAGITSKDDEILLYMITNTGDTPESLQEILDNFISAVSADAGELATGEPFLLQIGGVDGLAADVTGQFLGDDMEGRVAAVMPDDLLTFLAFGFAVNGRWENEGSVLFDTVLNTVSFALDTPPSDDSEIGTYPDFLLPIPSGQPVAEWNDFPIMPQAITGEEGDGSYSFVVKSTLDEVEIFYEAEMQKLDWGLLGVGDGENSSRLMIFQKEGAVASVSIFLLDDRTTFVFLVR